MNAPLEATSLKSFYSQIIFICFKRFLKNAFYAGLFAAIEKKMNS